MVNEVALALLFGMFGWNVPRLYLGLGLFVAIISGLVIGKLKMERHPEDWLQDIQARNTLEIKGEAYTWLDRLHAGGRHIKEILGKVWPYIMGKDAPWWSLPVAVVVRIPVYTNAAVIIRIVEALIATFAGVVAIGILLVGYVFNLLL